MLPSALRRWDIIPVTAEELSPAAYEHAAALKLAVLRRYEQQRCGLHARRAQSAQRREPRVYLCSRSK